MLRNSNSTLCRTCCDKGASSCQVSHDRTTVTREVYNVREGIKTYKSKTVERYTVIEPNDGRSIGSGRCQGKPRVAPCRCNSIHLLYPSPRSRDDEHNSKMQREHWAKLASAAPPKLIPPKTGKFLSPPSIGGGIRGWATSSVISDSGIGGSRLFMASCSTVGSSESTVSRSSNSISSSDYIGRHYSHLESVHSATVANRTREWVSNSGKPSTPSTSRNSTQMSPVPSD